jgi:3D (Asp-Asp-Asp) domain-containing protein
MSYRTRTRTRLAGLAAALFALGCGDDAATPDADVPGDVPADEAAGPDADADPDGGADADADADADAPVDVEDVPADAGPWVAIVEPADGATVDNPVRFRVAAGGVTTVRLYADDWPLGDAWDPAATAEQSYTFSGVGFERHVELFGYDGAGAEVAYGELRITVRNGSTDPGTPVGAMWNTYYYFANEADYGGADDTTLYDDSCNPIAEVPAEFSDDVCIEGSGRLADGTVINYADSCSCGRRCPTGGIICYVVLDPAEFPWGMGSRGNPLEPLRSWAVDNSFLPFGTVLYAAEWDGVAIPEVDGLGGFTHDGCFRADDVGGAIDGNHYDFFAGTAGMWRALEAIFPTRSDFTVYRDGDRCSHLAP